MNYPKYFIFLALLYINGSVSAQSSLLEELDKNYGDHTEYEIATFKSSRILMGHSTETLKKGLLEVGSRSRFWNLPDIESQSFIADKMSTRFSLEYGINNRLTYGIGGTTLDGIFDTFFKYKLIKQEKGGFPFNITLLQNGSFQSRTSDIDLYQSNDFDDRLSFTSQVLISSKITPQFSLQLSPTYIHRTSIRLEEDPNNQLALGIGGRYKLGGHVSIATEYYHVFNPLESVDTYNAFAIGVNWELSDVMLQFQMTNTQNVEEHAFMTQTLNNFNFNDGNFVFGFTGIFNIHFHNGLKNR